VLELWLAWPAGSDGGQYPPEGGGGQHPVGGGDGGHNAARPTVGDPPHGIMGVAPV
jgi:hypothetical protein